MNRYDEMAYGSANLVFVESLYQRYLEDPNSVDAGWVAYFETLEETPVPVSTDDNQTGTYDTHIHADPNPVIHRVESEELTAPIPGPIRDVLARVPLFAKVSEEGLTALAGIARDMNFKAGDYLCREGQTENDLFFIREGTVSIMKNGREGARLGPGELVGELAVLDTRPRSADILCKSDCHLLQIARGLLFQLLNEHAGLAAELLRGLSVRLRDMGKRQERVDRLVWAFRERGHVLANLDPLGFRKEEHPELNLANYQLTDKDLETKYSVKFGAEHSVRSLRNILETLKNIYCRTIGVQYMHIDDLAIQKWLRLRLEETEGRISLSRKDQLRILKKLTEAEDIERFLHNKFRGKKRFSLEGGESLIPLLDEAIEVAGSHDIAEVVIGMAHRGRLNVLVNIMGKPAHQVFREFQDKDPDQNEGKGDVKYHLGYGSDRVTSSGRKVHISLCFNPSHLEFVGPVVLGRARAKQDRFDDTDRSRALPLLIHGDAAFIGQGVTQEILNLSELPGYTTGGTVHVVLNNQIGFTTDPEEGRSTQYATDPARMLQIPIFHVNGEHPESVAHVLRLALDFRQKFKKDVVIDLYCYRKHGHNEGDDPSITQPIAYQAIDKRKSVREAYVENLLALEEHISEAEAEQIAKESRDALEEDYEKSRGDDYQYQPVSAGQGIWKGYLGGPEPEDETQTALPVETLRDLLQKLSTAPEHFKLHHQITKFVRIQSAMAKGKKPLNWGAGEALAMASLLVEGKPIRITGQDVERGTFVHRHAVWHDHESGARHTPLKNLSSDQAPLEIYNSPLSEVAVLGFEYGYSLDQPEGLVIWEAQFGDFCNVAQVIIDQFITSSEEKWRRLSGLCMLLPHGFEGQGPEHSSARLERFLMLASLHNIQVVNMTTPAQLFHCLRRQVHRPWRKPLIVMSPKSLLRHPKAVSSLKDFASGSFQKIIPDSYASNPKHVKRILLCSGKIYYELAEKREKDQRDDVAILRVEQFYPVPGKELTELLQAYPKATPVVWVQEEPFNMGAWPFLKLRLGETIDANGLHPLSRVSRPKAASPATGSTASHHREQEKLIEEAFQ